MYFRQHLLCKATLLAAALGLTACNDSNNSNQQIGVRAVLSQETELARDGELIALVDVYDKIRDKEENENESDEAFAISDAEVTLNGVRLEFGLPVDVTLSNGARVEDETFPVYHGDFTGKINPGDKLTLVVKRSGKTLFTSTDGALPAATQLISPDEEDELTAGQNVLMQWATAAFTNNYLATYFNEEEDDSEEKVNATEETQEPGNYLAILDQTGDQTTVPGELVLAGESSFSVFANGVPLPEDTEQDLFIAGTQSTISKDIVEATINAVGASRAELPVIAVQKKKISDLEFTIRVTDPQALPNPINKCTFFVKLPRRPVSAAFVQTINPQTQQPIGPLWKKIRYFKSTERYKVPYDAPAGASFAAGTHHASYRGIFCN